MDMSIQEIFNKSKERLIASFKTNNKIVLKEFNTYCNNTNGLVPVNKLFDYNIFVIIGIIKSYLYSNNITWFMGDNAIIIRYCNLKQPYKILKNSDDIAALEKLYGQDAERFITALEIDSKLVFNDIKAIEFIFDRIENPF